MTQTNADFNNYPVTRFAVVKKIHFHELQRMQLEQDYSPIKNMWKEVMQKEIRYDFIAKFELFQSALDGEDFINNMRTVRIIYSKIPLYN